MWFEDLTGFVEKSPDQVREKIIRDGRFLVSGSNGQRWDCGTLETPTLGELRDRVSEADVERGNLTLREVVADVQALHVNEANAGALFQVASQFNLLEMTGPRRTPEEGVGIYEDDRTQGPACAIAAGAGTIFRNYFVEVNGRVGQSEDNQIDCLSDIGIALGNKDNSLWQMQNGYALPSREGLLRISNILEGANENDRDALRKLLRIGVQTGVQVTLGGALHAVSQAYCSALPVAYSNHSSALWKPFATLILEASYEATLLAAVLNAAVTGNRTVFLTLLGGGVFGNEPEWIRSAIRRAVAACKDMSLNVSIVSYGASSPGVQDLVHELHP